MNHSFAASCLVSCVLSGVLCASVARAADIYQWVDESGRTHLSDVVPEKYKATAKRVDSRQFEPTPQQRAAAQALAARERDLAAKVTAADAAGSAAQGGAAAATRPASAPTAPASGASSVTDCATLRQIYTQSQECFAPFRNTNGSLKQGAYDKCVEVPDPSLKCKLERFP